MELSRKRSAEATNRCTPPPLPSHSPRLDSRFNGSGNPYLVEPSLSSPGACPEQLGCIRCLCSGVYGGGRRLRQYPGPPTSAASAPPPQEAPKSWDVAQSKSRNVAYKADYIEPNVCL